MDSRTKPLILDFGEGKHIVSTFYYENKKEAGVSVLPNPDSEPAVGQMGEWDIDESKIVLTLTFSNTESIDVWINALNRARDRIANFKEHDDS